MLKSMNEEQQLMQQHQQQLPVAFQWDPFSSSSSESDDDDLEVTPCINAPSASAAGAAITRGIDPTPPPSSKEGATMKKNNNGMPGNDDYIDTYTTCPIFRPTVQEFNDLGRYLNKIAKITNYEGFCKVIPPREVYRWTLTMDDIAKDWGKFNNAAASAGSDAAAGNSHVAAESNAAEPNAQTQEIQNGIENEHGTSTGTVEVVAGSGENAATEAPSTNGGEGQQQLQRLESENSKSSEDVVTEGQENELMVRNPIQQCVIVASQPGMFSVANVQKHDLPFSRFMRIALKFDRHRVSSLNKDEAPKKSKHGGDIEEPPFNPHEVERDFWKTLTVTKIPPIYGSDVPGSLANFPGVPFTMDDLPCALKDAGVIIDGITRPMLYIGMWRSMFAFHTEDLNLPSINVCHAGKPKMWYGVPPSAGKRLESLAESFWPSEHRECDQFLRHKTKLISPQKLRQNGVPFYRAVQYPGEIMITWPGCYHGGFNAGLNVAEAVNFLPPPMARRFIRKWGRKAKVCKCRPDSVKIDMRWFHHMLPLREKKRRPKNGRKRSKKEATGAAASSAEEYSDSGYSYVPTIGFNPQAENGQPKPTKIRVVVKGLGSGFSSSSSGSSMVSEGDTVPAPAPLIASECHVEEQVPTNFFLMRDMQNEESSDRL